MFNKLHRFASRASHEFVQSVMSGFRRFHGKALTGAHAEPAMAAPLANAECDGRVHPQFAQSGSNSAGAPPAGSEPVAEQWFRDRFDYAASVVETWLRPEIDLQNAALLDFGCGDGVTDLGVALKCRPRTITGVDITSKFDHLPGVAESQIGLKKLPGNLSFRCIEKGHRLAGTMQADAIFSWSTFEHIDRRVLHAIVADLFDLLPPGGLFFMQIEPLYYSPFGSHLRRFIQQPWAHLLWDEQVLKQTVLDFAGDIPGSEKDTLFANRDFADYKMFIFRAFESLNKLTANEICSLFLMQGFEIIREERHKVSQPVPQSLLSKYPEEDLLTNEICLLLRKPH